MYSVKEFIDLTTIEPLKNLIFQGSIVADSRKIVNGDLFIAYKGEYEDGRNYIPQAVAKGAVAVIYEDTKDFLVVDYGIPMYPVKNLPRIVGILVARLLNNLNDSLKIIGVTGTNGKTSITQWLAQALDNLGEKSSIIGTIGHGFGKQLFSSVYTTPDAVSLQNLICQFKQQGANYLAMEVSSHGIDQARVNGVEFDTVVFTNLTRDHLDYHKSLENYFAVKKRLFYWKNLRHAIINIDDPHGKQLIEELSANNPALKITSYGFSKEADIWIKQADFSFEGMYLSIISPWGEIVVQNSLLGTFNALNLTATLGVLCGFNYPLTKVNWVLNQIKPAKGRMETVRYPQSPLVIVDYAHTPDALQNTLQALQSVKRKTSKIWCVFGCGGDRDRGKRPLMGQVSEQYADISIVTSDNPRNEDPEQIIKDILPVKNAQFVEVDREKAIRYAIEKAEVKDIILIAGKGHENYQEIKGTRQHFDDLEIAVKYLKERK